MGTQAPAEVVPDVKRTFLLQLPLSSNQFKRDANHRSSCSILQSCSAPVARFTTRCHTFPSASLHRTLGGHMALRDTWIERREGEQASANALDQKNGRNTSQMHLARKGVITEEMAYVAKREK